MVVSLCAAEPRERQGIRRLYFRTPLGRVAVIVALAIVIGAPSAARAQAIPAADSLAVPVDSTLDLPTVIARALMVSPAATLGEENIETARSAGRVAAGAYLPSLTANASSLRSDIISPATIGATSGSAYSAGLASSIDLFTGGRRSADRARARADLTAAEATNVSQRYAVTLGATRAFYETLRGAELVAVANARVTRAERGLRYAQDRVRAGTATKSDELRARLELTSGRQQRLAAVDTMRTATLVLGRIVGVDGPIGARAPASLEPQPLALDDSAIVRLATDAAPSVTAAAASVRATEAATRSAKALYLPGVRLTGGYAWANQSPVLSATRPGWQLALGTSFPLFNGYLREDAVTRSQAQAEISRVTALDVTRQVRTESKRLIGALALATEAIRLAAEAQSVAREDLRVQTERYRAGISTSLDQLTSELALTQAELGFVAARYNYQVVRAQLEALVGRPL
ncbi:MAG: TolC family protein [Gemmatimonadaceae bacterium]